MSETKIRPSTNAVESKMRLRPSKRGLETSLELRHYSEH